MIKVDNKVKNIYYMLCYSFYGDRLNQKEEEKLGSEAFENIYNLFSLLLCLILKKQVKKGIYRNFIYEENELKYVKGKININQSIKNNYSISKKIVCEYDEFSENILLNRIIKTTIFYLIKSNKVGNSTKQELKKLSIYFRNSQIIEISNIKWNAIRFNKNNQYYKASIDICKLILNGLIVSDSVGNNLFKEFLDDTNVSAIYENFLKAYFKKHFPELKAKSNILYLTEENTSIYSFIPTMKTDITLEYENRKLIIDAKFYSSILSNSKYGTKIISSANIYQILAYVDNQDYYKKGNVYGMLLYAQTLNEPPISAQETLNKHKILIRTLDLNAEWDSITNRLNNIAISFKEDKFQ